MNTTKSPRATSLPSILGIFFLLCSPSWAFDALYFQATFDQDREGQPPARFPAGGPLEDKIAVENSVVVQNGRARMTRPRANSTMTCYFKKPIQQQIASFAFTVTPGAKNRGFLTVFMSQSPRVNAFALSIDPHRGTVSAFNQTANVDFANRGTISISGTVNLVTQEIKIQALTGSRALFSTRFRDKPKSLGQLSFVLTGKSADISIDNISVLARSVPN